MWCCKCYCTTRWVTITIVAYGPISYAKLWYEQAYKTCLSSSISMATLALTIQHCLLFCDEHDHLHSCHAHCLVGPPAEQHPKLVGCYPPMGTLLLMLGKLYHCSKRTWLTIVFANLCGEWCFAQYIIANIHSNKVGSPNLDNCQDCLSQSLSLEKRLNVVFAKVS